MQGLIRGCTNYSEQTINDIKDDIKFWQKYSKETKELFENTIKQLIDKGYWQKKVAFDFRVFCAAIPTICNTFINDFQIILDDIQNNDITERTINFMHNIYKVTEDNEKQALEAYNANEMWHDYGNADFALAEDLYHKARDFFATLIDVANAAERMKDYMKKEEKTVIVDQSIHFGDKNKVNKSIVGHNNQQNTEQKESWWKKPWKYIIIPLIVAIVSAVVAGIILHQMGI